MNKYLPTALLIFCVSFLFTWAFAVSFQRDNLKKQAAIAVNKEAFEELKRAWNENAVHIFFNESEGTK